MATIANATVKKYDGTTDVVYTAVKGAAGDRDTALWRNEAFNAIQGNRPVFAITSRSSGNGKQRIVEPRLMMPELVTDSTTGITSVRMKDVASAAFTINTDLTDSTHQECVAQFLNLCSSAAVRATIISGYSPT